MKVDIKSPETEIRKDKEGHVRKLNHRMNPIKSEDAKTKSILDVAADYIQEVAKIYAISKQTKALKTKPALDLKNDNLELRLLEDKRKQSLGSVSFGQTYFGIPIWKAGLSLRIDSDKKAIIGSVSTLVYDKIEVSPLNQKEAENFKDINPKKLASLLNFGTEKDFKINQSDQIYLYKYTKKDRLGEPLKESKSSNSISVKLKVPKLAENNYYLVREVLFSFAPKDMNLLHWHCFVEAKSGDVLFITPFVSGVIQGRVFEYDPITLGNNPNIVNTSKLDNVLNSHTKLVDLKRLQPSANGIQELIGGYALISDPVNFYTDPLLPTVDPPNEPPLTNFDYDVRTEYFAAVNAYFNIDRFIELIYDLGITKAQQFPNTQFPLHANHDAFGYVYAQAVGNANRNGAAGIAFGDITTTTPFLEMATSYRITLHEFGHLLLWDHAYTDHFGFAHSCGDSLAAIVNDPPSKAADRFLTFPWVDSVNPPIMDRRHDRAVSSHWAWGDSDTNTGGKDLGGYNSEQILSTTLFRIYRSLGGDSSSVKRKEYAMRLTLLLMLKGIQKIDYNVNTPHATDFADLMMEADTVNNPFTNSPLTLDSIDLGASHKVIRWGFEKQGAYQSLPAGPKEGEPPAVDVYIDDGRAGEYAYINNFWNTTDIINRRQYNANFPFTHEIPLLNTRNFVYVKIKNRGTTSASGIVVKAYHCKPSVGLVWPFDWTPFLLATMIYVPGILISGGERIVGPFQWFPTQKGHECILMTVSATGDAANTNTVDPAPHWALVPNDNNVAQRNVAPVPAQYGSIHIAAAFEIFQFTVLNPYHHAINVTLDVILPQLLVERGWQLVFPLFPDEEIIQLDSFDREGVLVQMQMIEGAPFTKQDVLNTQDREITINAVAEEGIIGGMSYYLDPDLEIYSET